MPRKAKASGDDDVQVMRAIGERIRALREHARISPKDLGVIGGISQAQQYRIEAGERVPDVIYMFKIAIRLGVSVDSLFTLGDCVTTPLDPGEQTLLDNYRHSAPADQAALKAASGARAAAAGTKRAKAG